MFRELDEASHNQLVRDLTLMLAELTSWQERGCSYRRAWRGYDWDALDELLEEGLIDFRRGNKSLFITEEGSRRAGALLDAYAAFRERSGATDVQSADADGEADLDGYRLELAFDFEKLVCRRTIAVPKSFTMDDLHTAIQACLNWMNYHLYDFDCMCGGERLYVTKPWQCQLDGSPEDRVFEASDALPLSVVVGDSPTFTYNYDYGDGWAIDICLAGECALDKPGVPQCVGGEGSAPPEDVGGEGGFADLLETLRHRTPEASQMREWAKGQGWERTFSASKASRRMARYEEFRAIEE